MSLRSEIEAMKDRWRIEAAKAPLQSTALAVAAELDAILTRTSKPASENCGPCDQCGVVVPFYCEDKHAEWHRSLARKPSLYVGTFMGAYRLDLTAEDGSEIPEHVRKVTTDWALRKEWPGVFKTPPPAPAPTRDGKEERRHPKPWNLSCRCRRHAVQSPCGDDRRKGAL